MYIVLDLEWNRPVSFSRKVKYPIQLNGEIIQIGAVKLNENLEEIDSFETFVKPKYYTKMNREVEELTGIHDDDLALGLAFPEAMNQFIEWCGSDNTVFTWGGTDLSVIRSNMIIHGMDVENIPEFFDAQLMFDDLEMMEGKSYSLEYAVVYFNISGTNGHHALYDARDTAAVMRRFDVDEWVNEERLWRLELEQEQMVS